MRKYTNEEKEILVRSYVDYMQLERLLNIEFGDTNDIEQMFDFLKEIANNRNISFTNVELDMGYFDFYYEDMLLTISIYNRRKVCKLCDSITIYDDKNGVELVEDININDLEKIVFNYKGFDL